MNKTRLLYITIHTLTVYHRGKHASDTEEILSCRNDDDGHREFSALIAKHPDIANIVLVDLVEEEYRTERAPWVIHGRKTLFDTKVRRTFRQATWHYWELQGREKQGRRDAQLLFSAITNPAPMQIWLDILRQHRSPLRAIRSVPHLSRQLLKPLGIDDPLALLITQQVGGLRQTLFRDGKLLISRLTPIDPWVSADDYASNLQGEILKTRRYLQRLQLLAADAPLDIHLVSSDVHLDAVHTQIQQETSITWHLHSLSHLPEKWLTHHGDHLNTIDHILVHLALCDRGNEYATATDRHYAYHLDIRRTLSALTVLLPIMAMLYGTTFVLEAMQHRQQLEHTKQALVRATEQYAALPLAGIPEALDPVWIRDAVRLADRQSAQAIYPEQPLLALSRIFSAYDPPQIRRIRWESIAAAQTDMDFHSHNAMPPEDGQYLYIEGRIDISTTSLRRAMQILDDIQREARVQLTELKSITLLEAPVDLSPQGQIERGQRDTQDAGRFVFRLHLSPVQPVSEETL